MCDRFGVTGRTPNARVAMKLDAAGFCDLVVATVDGLRPPESRRAAAPLRDGPL